MPRAYCVKRVTHDEWNMYIEAQNEERNERKKITIVYVLITSTLDSEKKTKTKWNEIKKLQQQHTSKSYLKTHPRIFAAHNKCSRSSSTGARRCGCGWGNHREKFAYISRIVIPLLNVPQWFLFTSSSSLFQTIYIHSRFYRLCHALACGVWLLKPPLSSLYGAQYAMS